MKKKQKYKKNDYLVYGINGCVNIIKSKKIEILSIDIMQSSPAEKKIEIQNYTRKNKHIVNILPKDHFLNKYSGISSSVVSPSRSSTVDSSNGSSS